MKWLRILLHGIGRFLLTAVFGIAPVKPVEAQQCLIAANHNTHLDILVLLRLFPLRRIHKVRVVAAQDYFSKGVPGLLTRTFLPLILINRLAKVGEAALRPVQDALQEDIPSLFFRKVAEEFRAKCSRLKRGSAS